MVDVFLCADLTVSVMEDLFLCMYLTMYVFDYVCYGRSVLCVELTVCYGRSVPLYSGIIRLCNGGCTVFFVFYVSLFFFPRCPKLYCFAILAFSFATL